MLLITCLILVFIGLAMLVYPLWLNVGAFQRTLKETFVPTAEHILLHPLPTPQFIDDITPPMGSKITANQRVCVVLLPGALSDVGDSSEEIATNIASSIRVSMNMEAIPRDATQVTILSILRRLADGRLSGVVTTWFNADLDSGLHMFQIEMRNSPLGIFGLGEFFSYTWVYQVEAEE